MKAQKNTPPKYAQGLLLRFLRDDLAEEVVGDLDEKFYATAKNKSRFRAKLNYWYQVLNYLRPFAIRKPKSHYLNHHDMYRSYFKIGWRNLFKNKVYSSINIIGLAMGMAVAMLIGMWVWDELSFDSYFQNREKLAQVLLNQTEKGFTYTGGTIAMPLGDALRTRYPNDFKDVSLTSWNDPYILSADDKNLSGEGMWVQEGFPEMFSLDMVSGHRNVLKDPSTILISASLSKALFGNTAPVGKSVRIDNKMDMTVGGVYADLPHNTTFYNTRLLLPWGNKENWRRSQMDWDNHCGQLFVLLGDHTDMEAVSAKIKNVPTPYVKAIREEVMLHPMKKLHLYDTFQNARVAGGRITLVWLIGTIGLFVLFLACINFMNLSTARSEKRSKEVGLRKTIGSVRSQLISQFLSESLVVVSIAFIISLGIAQLMLPFFNGLSDKQISIPWDNQTFWLLSLGFALTTGILSGSYPAFYLSGIKPVKALKGGSFHAGKAAFLPRKILVVTQFTVSIGLIIGTIVVFMQIQHAKNRPVGFNRSGLVSIPVNTPDLGKHYNALASELLQSGAIAGIARSSYSPSHFGSNNSIEWRGKDPDLKIFFRNVTVTPEFGKTIDWTIMEGRDFSSEIISDSNAVLINETAARVIGFEDPIGEPIKFRGDEYIIRGVVGDMATQSPYKPTDPAFFIVKGPLSVITMRIAPDMPVGEALSAIAPVFKKYNPDAPFAFTFVDDVYGRKFIDEERIGNLAALFAVLAIFISLLGLFGLASFVAEQRTKEIGIRKVLGASVLNLWQMLSRDFLALVILSCFIAVPIAYYFMNNWLDNYEYRTEIPWWIFVATGFGALLITLLTVSVQAIKAALANPVESLKTE